MWHYYKDLNLQTTFEHKYLGLSLSRTRHHPPDLEADQGDGLIASPRPREVLALEQPVGTVDPNIPKDVI